MRDRTDLHWHRDGQGFALHVGASRNPVLHVVPDPRCCGMWRIRRADGSQSDLVNLTRAKDAACALVLTDLNAPEGGKRPLRRPPMRFASEAVQ